MEVPLLALLLELSRAGWRTIVSCWENGEGLAVRISFGSEAEVERFLDVAAPLDDPDPVSERARARWGSWKRPLERPRSPLLGEVWDYHLYEEPFGPGRDSDEDPLFTAFEVLLPAGDLEVVLLRLRRWNASEPSRRESRAVIDEVPMAGPLDSNAVGDGAE